MKIERRPDLRETGILDYILIYVVAVVVGGIAGVFMAMRVSGKVYTDNNAPSLEAA